MTQIDELTFEQAVKDMRASRDMIALLREGLEDWRELEKGIWQMANCRIEIRGFRNYEHAKTG